MELARTGKVHFVIEYIGIGIPKTSIYADAKRAEDELRAFKKTIKKEDLKKVMKNIKVYQIEELTIINLGKGLS